MCYVAPRQVGVRELRQNLSVYLRRVTAGETLEVTERGRPVALLAPLPQAATALGRLVAAGRASAPVGSLGELGPPPRVRLPMSLSRALEIERAERV